jgi:hypothetical protein
VASAASFPAARISCVVGENEAVTDAASSSELRAGEKRAAEAVLTRAWGEKAEVGAVAGIWDRAHVARLELADGRSVVLKRREDPGDDEGGTTMRPRLLAWLRNFIDRADGGHALPRLRALIALMHEQLSSRWPRVRVPEYPALARPGSEPVPVPDWWPPRPGQKMDP